MCKHKLHLITAMLHMHVVRQSLAVYGPCANLLSFPGPTRRSRRNRAVMVSLLSVFARSEDVYDMHFVPLRARAVFAQRLPERT